MFKDDDRVPVEDRFPWIDPTLGYPDDTLIEGVSKIAVSYVAARTGSAHKALPWMEPIHSSGLEHIDGHDWELFTTQLRGIVNGRDWVWGQFVEGLGMIHVMVPADFIRELTPTEREYYSGRRFGMYGSHSGNLSYTFDLPVLG